MPTNRLAEIASIAPAPKGAADEAVRDTPVRTVKVLKVINGRSS